MKKFLTATSVALFAMSSPMAFAQSDTANYEDSTSSGVASGGAAGSAGASTLAYGAVAAIGAAAVIGTAVALASSGDDDKNVDLPATGTTGTN